MSLHSIEIKKKTISRYNECAKKCMFVKKLNEYSNEREKKNNRRRNSQQYQTDVWNLFLNNKNEAKNNNCALHAKQSKQ